MSGRPQPDRWLVLEVARPDDPHGSDLVVQALLRLAASGIEEREDAFLVYLPPPEEGDPGRVAAALAERLARLPEAGRPMVAHRWQRHEDWAESWRSGLAPRRITSRLVVTPSWLEPATRPGDVVVVIDPGMAFGTAEHPSTRGSLRLLDARVEEGERVADVGSGSGILAVAAARLGAGRVLALDSDPWSCAAARENAELNRVADRVEVRETRVVPDFLPGEPPFDGIVANIGPSVLLDLLPGFASGLVPGGWLILSGIPEDEADEMRVAARERGLHVEAEDREEGWWSVALTAP